MARPRRADRGDEDTLGERPTGGRARSEERKPDRDVRGGQPGARMRCLAIGTHSERDEDPTATPPLADIATAREDPYLRAALTTRSSQRRRVSAKLPTEVRMAPAALQP
jgi:hypothetical protein